MPTPRHPKRLLDGLLARIQHTAAAGLPAWYPAPMAYRSSHKRQGLGAGPFLAMGVVFVLVAGAIYVLPKRIDRGAEEAQAEEKASPFADVPEEVHLVRRQDGDAPKSVPFDDVQTELDDNEAWQAALAVVEDARALVQLAVDALDDGERATAREKGKAAQEMLLQAVDATRAYEEKLVRERGDKDATTRKVLNTRAKWRQEIMTLKKSGAL